MNTAGTDNRLGAIEQRLSRMETIMENLQHRLLGNGQPGELSLLSARVTGDMTALSTRVKGLEEFRWKAVGGMGAAVFAYEIVVKFLKG